MFVKIISNKTKASRVFETDMLEVLPGPEQTILNMSKYGTDFHETCANNSVTVYLMNDTGKTLDTYRL